MLVAKLWKEADTPPPVYGMPDLSPPDPKAVEESGQGLRLEVPEGTVGQEAVARGATEAVLEFLGDTRVGCRTAAKAIEPREEEGQASDGEEASEGEEVGAQAPLWLYFPLSFFCLFPLSLSFVIIFLFPLLSYFSFLCLAESGGRGSGSPGMTQVVGDRIWPCRKAAVAARQRQAAAMAHRAVCSGI